MNTSYVFINTDFVPADKATLPVSDLSIQRGYGVFDFFRVVNRAPLFLDDHLTRFFSSAQEMRLPLRLSRHQLKGVIQSLIQKNNIADGGIRLTLTGGASTDGYSLAAPNLIIAPLPVSLPTKAQYQSGIRLITQAHQRQLPHVKTIDYLMAIWLQPRLNQNSADDVLYHQSGIVTECPRANFFIVTQNDVIITPGRNILRGITRQKIIQLARQEFAVEEREVSLDDIKSAKEAFITSSTKQQLPVRQIDTIAIPDVPGKITTHLHERFMQLLGVENTALLSSTSR